MREKFVYPMREKVYGWYPPAKGIYHNPKTSNSYLQECLYRHMNSRFIVDKQGVETPEPPTHIKIELSPRPQRKPSSIPSRQSRCQTAPIRSHSATPVPEQKQQPIKKERSYTSLEDALVVQRPPVRVPTAEQKKPLIPERPKTCIERAPSAGRTTSAMGRPSTAHVSHFKSWRTQIPETGVVSPAPSPPKYEKPVPALSVHTPTLSVDGAQKAKPDRIKSASVHRDRISPPRRTIKSAGLSRSIPGLYPDLSSRAEDRPKAPAHLASDEEEISDLEEDDSSSVEDYDERLKKYGWRMEVPGDPLNLKRCTKRLPYTVKVPEPEVAPNPPLGKMENFDTFFYNTIPRKPLSFTIHQEWMSEVLHAKRMELQKREGGINYRYKNFSFVY